MQNCFIFRGPDDFGLMRLRLTRLFIAVVVLTIIVVVYRYTTSSTASDDEIGYNRTTVISALSSLLRDCSVEVPYHSSDKLRLDRVKCEDFESGLISGDLCNRICFYQNISASDILKVSEGTNSKVSIVFKSNGQRLILKTDNLFAENADQFPVDISSGDSTAFINRLLDAVNLHLSLDWPMSRSGYLLEMLWPSFRRTFNLSTADKRSLWSLVSQDEFVTLSVLQSAQIFPKIMGTCGHFYATDYVSPLVVDSYFYSSYRGKILMHISGTLKLMYTFINEPLHWCDVRMSSLGLSGEYPKRFIFTDADLIFTESRMQALFAALRCRSDDECRFYDCTAKCDKKAQRCSSRSNDNIEVVCRKLVHEMYGKFWSRSNRFLEICHSLDTMNSTQRIQEMHSYWAWTLTDL